MAQVAFTQLYFSFHLKQDVHVHTAQWEQCLAHVLPPNMPTHTGREVPTHTMLLLLHQHRQSFGFPALVEVIHLRFFMGKRRTNVHSSLRLSQINVKQLV